jgi:hypothetical protein
MSYKDAKTRLKGKEMTKRNNERLSALVAGGMNGFGMKI